MFASGIQKRQRTRHNGSSSIGGKTNTNALTSVVLERSKPPKHRRFARCSTSTAWDPSSQIERSIHRSAPSVHVQKFRRRTMFCFEGIPVASLTCSRRYLRVTETSRQGLVLIQTASSVH